MISSALITIAAEYGTLHDLFCGGTGCRFSQDGKVLYLDAQHLSTKGANLALTRFQLSNEKASNHDEDRRRK